MRALRIDLILSCFSCIWIWCCKSLSLSMIYCVWHSLCVVFSCSLSSMYFEFFWDFLPTYREVAPFSGAWSGSGLCGMRWKPPTLRTKIGFHRAPTATDETHLCPSRRPWWEDAEKYLAGSRPDLFLARRLDLQCPNEKKQMFLYMTWLGTIGQKWRKSLKRSFLGFIAWCYDKTPKKGSLRKRGCSWCTFPGYSPLSGVSQGSENLKKLIISSLKIAMKNILNSFKERHI